MNKRVCFTAVLALVLGATTLGDAASELLSSPVPEFAVKDATLLEFVQALNSRLSSAPESMILPAFEEVPADRHSVVVPAARDLRGVLDQTLVLWDCGWYVAGGRVMVSPRIDTIRHREVSRMRACEAAISKWLDGPSRTLRRPPTGFQDLLDSLSFRDECGSMSYLVSPRLWPHVRFDSGRLRGSPREILTSVVAREDCLARAVNDLLFVAEAGELDAVVDSTGLLIPPYSRCASPTRRVRIVDWISSLREAAWLIPINDSAIDESVDFPVDQPVRLADASTATTLFVLGRITALEAVVVRSASRPTLYVEFRTK